MWITRLYYFEPGDRLIGTARSLFSSEAHLFSVDPSTGAAEVVESWLDGDVEGMPDALTALGEAPTRHEQLLPVIVAGPGASGTEWSTELWLFNPASTAVRVSLRRVTRPEQVRDLTLPAHGSLGVADALAWVGGGASGDGSTHDALAVTSDYRWGEQLAVAARVSTPDQGSGGRYGHEVLAVPGQVGYSNHTPYKVGDEEIYQLRHLHNSRRPLWWSVREGFE
jgi:hypothetical protein